MRSRQFCGRGSAGSVTASRAAGASRSVKTYSRPSRPGRSEVWASSTVNLGQGRPGRVARGQVGDPHVLARRGADGAGDDQPAAVHADAGPVDRRSCPGPRRRRARPCPVRCRPCAGRRGGGTAPRRPGPGPAAAGVRSRRPCRRAASRPRVAAPVDGAVDERPGGDVDDAQQGLLGAALRQLVGEQAAFLVRLPVVQGGPAGRVDGHRVDERGPRPRKGRRGPGPGRGG